MGRNHNRKQGPEVTNCCYDTNSDLRLQCAFGRNVVSLAVLVRSAGPIKQDPLMRVLKVRFTFSSNSSAKEVSDAPLIHNEHDEGVQPLLF